MTQPRDAAVRDVVDEVDRLIEILPNGSYTITRAEWAQIRERIRAAEALLDELSWTEHFGGGISSACPCPCSMCEKRRAWRATKEAK